MATHELDITTMAHGGSGIGRVDGRVVFTPGVIPGEVVEVEIVEDSKKSLWRAQPLRVLSPSPHRIPHIWPEANIERPWAARAGGRLRLPQHHLSPRACPGVHLDRVAAILGPGTRPG